MTYDRQATCSLFPVLRSCFELLCIALDSTFIIDPIALRIQWFKIYRRSQELVLVMFILHVTSSAVMTPISHSFYDLLCQTRQTQLTLTGKQAPSSSPYYGIIILLSALPSNKTQDGVPHNLFDR